MRKEIIVAILVGIIFGGIFTYGIRRANLAFKPAASDTNNQTLDEKDQDLEQEIVNGLTILAPDQYDVFTQESVTITGITKPESTVVISAEDEDFVITSEQSGEFSQEVKLNGGLNNIIIQSFSKDILIAEEYLKLVFTTEIDI